MPKKLRIVVDTNVIISGLISPSSNPGKIVDLWRSGNVLVIWSNYSVTEVIKVINRPNIQSMIKTPKKEVKDLIRLLKSYDDLVYLRKTHVRTRDIKDDLILALAMQAGAEFLITGDKDLLAEATNPQIKPLLIVAPQDFVEQFS